MGNFFKIPSAVSGLGIVLLLPACDLGKIEIGYYEINSNSSSSVNESIKFNVSTLNVSTQDTSNISITLPGYKSNVSGNKVVAIKQSPSVGSVSITSQNTISYSPHLPFHGTDSFSIVLRAGDIESEELLVTVQVSSDVPKFYVSENGNDATAVVNQESLSYRSLGAAHRAAYDCTFDPDCYTQGSVAQNLNLIIVKNGTHTGGAFGAGNGNLTYLQTYQIGETPVVGDITLLDGSLSFTLSRGSSFRFGSISPNSASNVLSVGSIEIPSGLSVNNIDSNFNDFPSAVIVRGEVRGNISTSQGGDTTTGAGSVEVFGTVYGNITTSGTFASTNGNRPDGGTVNVRSSGVVKGNITANGGNGEPNGGNGGAIFIWGRVDGNVTTSGGSGLDSFPIAASYSSGNGGDVHVYSGGKVGNIVSNGANSNQTSINQLISGGLAGTVTTDSGSIFGSIQRTNGNSNELFGCIDTAANNYSNMATTNDGSCTY